MGLVDPNNKFNIVSEFAYDEGIGLLLLVIGTQSEFVASCLLHLLEFVLGMNVTVDLLSLTLSRNKICRCHALIELLQCERVWQFTM